MLPLFVTSNRVRWLIVAELSSFFCYCNAKVTPEKDAKKHKTNSAVVSPDSLGQKRSRSG